MSEGYVEVLVQRELSPGMKAARGVTAVLTGVLIIAAFSGGWIAAAAAAAGCGMMYLLSLYSQVEYEYTYVDHELQIDRILGKSRRKRMETLDIRQLEVFAPLTAHQLDAYRSQQAEWVDYSSKAANRLEARYLLCLPGKQLILEPTERMVEMMRSEAPRKVFGNYTR